MLPGQFSAFKVMCTGRVCVRMYEHTWRPVLSVWHVNLRVHGGHPWDMSVTSAKGNRYVLVMVDCFSRWTEACPLPDKTALSVANDFFQYIVCRFGTPTIIHSDQGREFESNVMQELCLLCSAHKNRTTPYHPESDGLVERFNRNC